MKIHRLILIAMLFITSYPLYSQTVRGKIVDADNQPLPYANVVLLSLPDSAFVTGTVSDEQGVFSLPAHEAGGLLRISSIGYTTAISRVRFRIWASSDWSLMRNCWAKWW